MALKASLIWTRLHFLVRVVGLTGLLVVAVGVVWAGVDAQLTPNIPAVLLEHTHNLIFGGAQALPINLSLMYFGGLAVLLALLVEVFVMMEVVAGQRSALGFNTLLQLSLATLLLVGVNLYSFEHHRRLDLTRRQQFTLPTKLQDDLSKLRVPGDGPDSRTTIVVYQRTRATQAGENLTDYAYDDAAERQVVEKIHDLVDQFREFGPQFRVVVLDVKKKGFKEILDKETANNPALREAIDKAPESSIFFAAQGKVQRLSFNDLYLLDKESSQKANDGKGNLVLLDQGIEPFARKVLQVEEKKPVVGLVAIHEWLTTEGPEEFGMSGLKKALTARGFEVRDIVLKKWSENAPPEPSVYTYDESKFEQLEEQLADLDSDIKNLNEQYKKVATAADVWKKSSLEDLTKQFAKEFDVARITEKARQREVDFYDRDLALLTFYLERYREERQGVVEKKATLNVEGIGEKRRITDLKAKLDVALADCDLLMVPRTTLRNVTIGDYIPMRAHKLDVSQIQSIKDYIKSGKPVLACLGPTSEPPPRPGTPPEVGPDELEDLFAQLGVHLNRQTVLFDAERKSFAERRSGLLTSGVNVDVPPVEFEWSPDAMLPAGRAALVRHDQELKPNPLRSSMAITARSLGKQNFDLRIRHPRPITVDLDPHRVLAYDPVFMVSSPASWNDDNPFPSRERTPRYEPSSPDDPMRSSPDAKRRGPFPIGVAFETMVPADWYGSKDAHPARVRLAVIGHGGVFTGVELPPAREKLLLDTCNWLLGRDNQLTLKDEKWSFPRVQLSQRQQNFWMLGTWLGLPVLFAYLGILVVLARRVR